MLHRSLISIFLFYISTSLGLAAPIAIVGDSLSTGALASDEIRFEPLELKNIMENGEKSSFGHVVMAPPLAQEMQNPLEFIIDLTRYLIETENFNYFEKSYAFRLAKNIDANAKVYMAARNGARARSFIKQIQRVNAVSGDEFPKTWIIGYHGNDFCSLDSRSSSYEYIEGIKKGLGYLNKTASSMNLKVVVYLVSPVAIGQLVVRDRILSKRVRAYGKEMSCKDLANLNASTVAEKYQQIDNPNLQMFMRYIFPTSPANYCPALFLSERRNLKVGDEVQQSIKGLENLIKEQSFDSIQLSFLTSGSKVLFDAEEIANDCMHLSAAGHEKLFNVIASDIP